MSRPDASPLTQNPGAAGGADFARQDPANFVNFARKPRLFPHRPAL